MPVTIKECPHCYTRVAFKDDGICPACNKRFSDYGADPSKTLFPISERSMLAPVCLYCGGSADCRVAITQRSRSHPAGILRLVWSIFAYSLALVAHGFIHLLGRGETQQNHPYRRIRVSVPLCDRCRTRHGAPKPMRVNFEEGTLWFLLDQAVVVQLSRRVEPGGATDESQLFPSETKRTSGTAGSRR